MVFENGWIDFKILSQYTSSSGFSKSVKPIKPTSLCEKVRGKVAAKDWGEVATVQGDQGRGDHMRAE
jgi:hypothetical protein